MIFNYILIFFTIIVVFDSDTIYNDIYIIKQGKSINRAVRNATSSQMNLIKTSTNNINNYNIERQQSVNYRNSSNNVSVADSQITTSTNFYENDFLNNSDIITSYKKYLEADDKEQKENEDQKENSTNNVSSSTPLNYKISSTNYNRDLKVIGSKSMTVYILVINIVICIIMCLYFGIIVILNNNNNVNQEISLSYLDFHEKRGYYILSSILFFKLYATTDNSYYLSTYKDYLSKALINEQNIQTFLLSGEYNKFSIDIFTIDSSSICDYFLKVNDNSSLSNNVTHLTEGSCNSETKIVPITNKGLTQINLYIINYLKDKYISYYEKSWSNYNLNYTSFDYTNYYFFGEYADKYTTNTNVTKEEAESNLVYFLNMNEFEIIEILSQYAVRQAINEINNILLNKLDNQEDKNLTIIIIYSIIYLILAVLILVFTHLISSSVIFVKKKRNDILMKMLPYQFIENYVMQEKQEIIEKQQMIANLNN